MSSPPIWRVLSKLFGLDAAALSDRIRGTILTRLTHGLFWDIATDMKELHAKTMDGLDKLAMKHDNLEFKALVARVFEDSELAARRDECCGRDVWA